MNLHPLRLIIALAAAGPAGIAGAQPGARAPLEDTASAFVAFRFDDSRVIAVVKVLSDMDPRRGEEGLSAPPAAQYGFPYFTPPDELRARVPAAIQRQMRWQLHVAPGRVLEAIADDIVGGTAACEPAVGVLLTIARPQQDEFKALPQKYFVAEPAPPAPAQEVAIRTDVAALPPPSLTSDQKQALEATLNGVLTREWPRIHRESDADIARMADAPERYQRSWAEERRRVDEQLARGNARLSYDVQAFRLDPSGAATYFVRGQWLAGRRQAFAATLWLRGDVLEVIEEDSRPSSWLRMFEFQGAVRQIHLGQVLNVLDRNRDGRGEILFAHGGYEGRSIELLEYSPDGFVPTGISFAAGC